MKNIVVTDKKKLVKSCRKCASVKKGVEIGKKLLVALEDLNGVGLAANQIGINSRVCVIKVTKPIILVNPVITGKFEKIYFQEGCLSFPGDYIITERYGNIAVTADNFSEVMFFDAKKNALECACVQHEIDHLNGITMHDRRAKGENNHG